MKQAKPAKPSCDPSQWTAAWDANASDRAIELTSNVDSAYQSLTHHVEQHLAESLSPGARVLDIGCGVGALTNYLSALDYDAVGIDPSVKSIRMAQVNYPKGQYFQMSVEEFSQASVPPFHAIVANMVLHTARDVDSLLRSAYSLLVQDGVLVVTLPHPWHYLRQREDVTFDLAKYYDVELYWLNFRIYGHKPHPQKVPYIHRPIEKYISSLTKNGFILKEMEEPDQVGLGKPNDIAILRAVRGLAQLDGMNHGDDHGHEGVAEF